jgi:hypothetical protein
MAFLNNVPIYFVKCDPKRPNAYYNKENPTWEVQIRTESRAQAKEWEALNIPVKAVIPDEEGAKPYWKAVLRKKSIKKDTGEKTNPPEVMDGNLNPVDPNTIGNGSIANIRIFQYDYPKGDSGTMGVATVLMAIQLVRHQLYTAPPRETFSQTQTEIIAEQPKAMPEDGGDAAPETPKVPSVPTPAVDPNNVF